MKDNFKITLNSPLTKEDWAVLADYEHENSNSVTFQTPKGKQVKYIKADILDKIRAEIARKANSGQWSEATIYGMQKSIAIIDKYRQEG